MQNFQNHVNFKQTPQSQKIPGRGDMVANRGGGFGFKVEDHQFLLRFLVTGAGAGTYRTDVRMDVTTSIHRLAEMVDKNGEAILDEVVKFSTEGRGPSNDPALYVLALCAASSKEAVRKKALDPNTVTQVARTGTHLFTFLEYVKSMRGWGRSMRRAVAAWYTSKNIGNLTYQVLKYRQRNGWTHRDVLRKSHPITKNSSHQSLFKYITDERKTPSVISEAKASNTMVAAFEEAQSPKVSVDKVIQMVTDHGLPWEFLQTQHLAMTEVWAALLPSMNVMALVRNLGRLSSIGLLTKGSAAEKIVADKLANEETLKRSRIHPFNLLNAFSTYKAGKGLKGSMEWKAVPRIVDALDQAFYTAFGNVVPSGKRMMLSLDVSGSMDWNSISSNPHLSCRVGAMAMSMITAAVEENVIINGFSSSLVNLDVSPMCRMDDNILKIHGLPFSSTDCSLPMLHATKNNLKIDTFVIYTDNETWAGNIHPNQALQRYREKSGINAKLITVSMDGRNTTTIADPRDPKMLDVVGFDTATPNVISTFSTM